VLQFDTYGFPFLALGETVAWDFGFVREQIFCLGFSVISTVGSLSSRLCVSLTSLA
jgi:hypothetical protein